MKMQEESILILKLCYIYPTLLISRVTIQVVTPPVDIKTKVQF